MGAQNPINNRPRATQVGFIFGTLFWNAQEWPKRGPREAQEGPRERGRPEEPKRSPRGAARGAQEEPKTAPRAFQKSPRQPKTCPRPPQGAQASSGESQERPKRVHESKIFVFGCSFESFFKSWLFFSGSFLDPVLDHFWDSFWDHFGVKKSTLRGQVGAKRAPRRHQEARKRQKR